jgi:hypothetical protein
VEVEVAVAAVQIHLLDSAASPALRLQRPLLREDFHLVAPHLPLPPLQAVSHLVVLHPHLLQNLQHPVLLVSHLVLPHLLPHLLQNRCPHLRLL